MDDFSISVVCVDLSPHSSEEEYIYILESMIVSKLTSNFIITVSLHGVTVETVIKAWVKTSVFHIIGCREPFTSIIRDPSLRICK